MDEPSSDISQLPLHPHLQELASILECPLCLSLVCEPISISCGHTFCRVCLVKALRRHKKRCPTCREVCHVCAENAAENVMIKGIAVATNPELYRARLQETEEEKSSWSTVYPVFYYNSVMFPGSKLSLHLFEPRYKIMMQRVVDSTKSFAYVPNYSAYQADVGDIALVAKLKEVEFLSDGRCLLEAVLTGRFKIVEHYVEDGTQGLHFCRLEPFRDAALDAAGLEAAAALMEQGRAALGQVAEAASSMAAIERQFGPAPSAPEDFGLWLAAVSPLGEGEKVALLRSDDSLGRLRCCVAALAAYQQRLLARQQAVSLLASAGSGVVNATSSLGRLVASLLNGNPSQGANPNNAPGDLGQAATFDNDDEEEEEQEEDGEEVDSQQSAEH